MTTRSVIVLATVLSIREKFSYPCCTRCHRRVRAQDDVGHNRYWCELCQEEYNQEWLEYRYRISVLASDTTQLTEITVFGSCLDKFFGATATDFTRFVTDLSSQQFCIPPRRLVSEAIEQCFVGSSLQFGFRVLPPFGRTVSQITRNSPFHLKNIVKKQPNSVNTSQQYNELTNQLACQLVRCSSMEESPTVMEILQESLKKLSSSSSTPRSQGDFANVEHVQREVIKPSSTANPSIQGNGSSPIYCTPQGFGSLVSPLRLTGNRTWCSASMDDEPVSSLLQEIEPETSQERKRKNFNSFSTRDSVEQQQPCQHACADYTCTDFPSSEDVSVFLADLVFEDDTLDNAVRRTLRPCDSKTGHNIASVVTSEGAKDQELCAIVQVSLKENGCALDCRQNFCSGIANKVLSQNEEDRRQTISERNSKPIPTCGTNRFRDSLSLLHLKQSRDITTRFEKVQIDSCLTNSQHKWSEERENVDLLGSRQLSQFDTCEMTAYTLSSPELFSNCCAPTNEASYKTQDLFSSPGTFSEEERSCLDQYNNTLDLFLSSTRLDEPTNTELNSASLSSSFGYSGKSFVPDPHSQHTQNDFRLVKDFKNNYPTIRCHSTPVTVFQGGNSARCLNSYRTLPKLSPLVANSGLGRRNDQLSLQGTPLLFSQTLSSPW